MDVFDSISKSLKGTTRVEVPRVSRETIISVLQSHTDMLKNMKKDHNSLSEKVTRIDTATQENTEKLLTIEEDNAKRNSEIEELFRMNNEFSTQIEELSWKVAELYTLKKNIEEQKAFVEQLHVNFEKFNKHVSSFMDETDKTMSGVLNTCKDTSFQMAELKDYVEHFGDNLFLSSSQITVEPSCGFAPKPLSLTDVMKTCNNNFEDLQTQRQLHSKNIEDIHTALDSKAPDSVLVNVNTLEKKVSTIEVHLQKEEEQGIGAIRKACDELSMAVQSMTLELAEKIDEDSVGVIVHEKYEEVVKYLQDALQSSVEDENNFKKKADEIQDMVVVLGNAKADKTEIAHLQELMVKSEALLKKVGSQMNIKEKLKDFINKNDLADLLEMKLDKLDFEQMIASGMFNQKRSKKLSSVPSSLPLKVMDALSGVGTGRHSENTTGRDTGGREQSPVPIITLGRQLNNTVGPGAYGAGNGTMLGGTFDPDPSNNSNNNGNPGNLLMTKSADFLHSMKAKRHMSQRQVAQGELPADGPPGSFRTGAEGGRAGSPKQGRPGGLNAHSVTCADSSGRAGGVGYGKTDYPFVPPNYQMSGSVGPPMDKKINPLTMRTDPGYTVQGEQASMEDGFTGIPRNGSPTTNNPQTMSRGGVVSRERDIRTPTCSNPVEQGDGVRLPAIDTEEVNDNSTIELVQSPDGQPMLRI